MMVCPLFGWCRNGYFFRIFHAAHCRDCAAFPLRHALIPRKKPANTKQPTTLIKGVWVILHSDSIEFTLLYAGRAYINFQAARFRDLRNSPGKRVMKDVRNRVVNGPISTSLNRPEPET